MTNNAPEARPYSLADSPLPARRLRRPGRRTAAGTAAAAVVVGALLIPAWHSAPAAGRAAAHAASGSSAAHAVTTGNTTRLAVLEPDGISAVRLAAQRGGARLTRVAYTRSVYPVRDGYRDRFTVTATTNQRVQLMLVIRTRAEQFVHVTRARHAAGRFTISWNGRYPDGAMVRAGTYLWRIKWRGADGIWRSSAPRLVVVSDRHLVTRTKSWTLAGDAYYRAGGSDPACGSASRRASTYTHGLLLSNACEGSFAAAFYDVHVPQAISYSRLGVVVWGYTKHPGTRIFRAFYIRGSGGSFGDGAFEVMPNASRQAWSFGSVPAARHVTRLRDAVVALSVDDRPSGARDLDIQKVKITLSYRVLV